MRALLLVAVLLLLAACTTQQVQNTCADTKLIIGAAQPFLFAAPPEVKAALMIMGAGTYICGTPEYAAARERVVAWIHAQNIKPR